MATWAACLWGLAGVGLVEAYLLWGAVSSSAVRRWPWVDDQQHRHVGFYVVALACRCVMGVGLDAVYAATHQVSGPLGAVTLGIGTPLIIKQMAERQQGSPPASPLPAQASPQPRRAAGSAEGEQMPEDADVR